MKLAPPLPKNIIYFFNCQYSKSLFNMRLNRAYRPCSIQNSFHWIDFSKVQSSTYPLKIFNSLISELYC